MWVKVIWDMDGYGFIIVLLTLPMIADDPEVYIT